MKTIYSNRKIMKKTLLNLLVMLIAITATAQWQPISTGLPDFPPTALISFEDDIVIGTYGGGIFKTNNNGDNWIDINGNLGDLHVNNLRGHASLTSMFISTAGGPYYTFDQVTYEDCTSSGLTNANVTYFSSGDESISLDNIIGTNGGGVFDSEDYFGPWGSFGGALAGDAAYINDLWGIDDGGQTYYILATEGGIYIATVDDPTWVLKSNGLTGEALSVQNIVGLGTMALIATHGGVFMSYDMCETWIPVLPDEMLNTINIVLSSYSSTGYFVFAFGENGFYSEDFQNFYPLDMSGIDGEVMCMVTNSTHMFLGIETTYKSGDRGMGMFRKPLSLVVGTDENIALNSGTILRQNFPNPFTKSSQIFFNIPEASTVSLTICDIHGKVVQTPINKYLQSGEHTVTISANKLPEGIYYYYLVTNREISLSKKMIVVH